MHARTLATKPAAPARLRHAGALLGAAAGCALLGLVLTARAVTQATVIAGGLDEPWTALAVVRVDGVVEMVALVLGLLLTGWFTVSLCTAAVCVAARVVGRRWVAGERLVARYAPEVVRRALLLFAGTGLALAGAGLPAVAAVEDVGAPTQLGWSATLSLAPRAASAAGMAVAPATATPPTAAAPPAVLVATPPAASAPPSPSGPPSPSAPPPPSTPPPTTDPPSTPSPAATITVRPGDSLWAIAAAHLPADADPSDVAAAWPSWYAVNAGVVGDDPDLIRPGQRLVPPSTAVTGAAR